MEGSIQRQCTDAGTWDGVEVKCVRDSQNGEYPFRNMVSPAANTSVPDYVTFELKHVQPFQSRETINAGFRILPNSKYVVYTQQMWFVFLFF